MREKNIRILYLNIEKQRFFSSSPKRTHQVGRVVSLRCICLQEGPNWHCIAQSAGFLLDARGVRCRHGNAVEVVKKPFTSESRLPLDVVAVAFCVAFVCRCRCWRALSPRDLKVKERSRCLVLS